MKKISFLLLILSIALSASLVPVERARKVAVNYYQNYAPTTEKDNIVEKVLTKEYLGQSTWYVFKFTKGWVIVSADDAVRPILGYSFEGKITDDLDNMNNPFVNRFSFFDKQIVHTVREKFYINTTAQKEWKDFESNVFPASSSVKLFREPLLETTWHQDYPFNAACPAGSPTGSVATAMAQIMRYHESPRTGWGTAYYIDNTGDPTGIHNVNFSDQFYDWSLMTTLDGNDLSQSEIDEISEICYHTGVSVHTDYNTGIASATLEDAGNSFNGHFGYGGMDYGPVYISHGTIFDPSYFNDIITDELDGDTPLLWGYLGSDESVGFVIDGYKVDVNSNIYEYHFNWGWAGEYNGWFRLDDLTPGSSDFTASQECVRHLIPYWPNAMWAPPQNLQCTVTDLENVTMTWEWIDSDWMILSRFDILLDGELIDSVPDSVMSYYFEGVCVGEHTFTASAVFGFEYYPEWYSSPSGRTLEILPEANFPVPYFTQEASVELYNRQKIGLAWAKPFCGTEYLNEGFETAIGNYEMVTEGWVQKGSDNFPPTSWGNVVDAGWKYISRYGGTGYYKYVYEGDRASYCGLFWGDDNAPFTYLISNDTLSMSGNPVLSFWLKSPSLSTEIQIVKYTGDFTEVDPSVYIEIISTISPDTLDTWEYKYVILPAGDYRIGIVKDMSAGWSIIDNLFIGSDTYPDGNQPVSYDIYRNDELADNIPVTGLYQQYEDRNFTENWNEYYIRAVYPTGSSLKSKPTKVYINANPVPLALTGSYDNMNNEVDLSWYYPGHYPPHWFGYNYESDTFSYQDWDYDNRYLLKNITIYSPQEFDMAFPIHIDKVGASFYEDVNNDKYWTSDQFRFLVVSGPFWSDSIIYTSPWLTADPNGEWCDHTLPETLTLNEDWYVAVEPGDPATGTPSIALNVHGYEEEPVWHSIFQSSSSPITAGSWQALNYQDYSILCYGFNDEPVITKQYNFDTNMDISDIAVKPLIQNTNIINVLLEREDRFNKKSSSDKGLESYNVYRNGSFLGNTSDKCYTDMNPLASNTYYITAVYEDPSGESTASNTITLGPPPVINMPESITKILYSGTSEACLFDISNSGDGYLDYSLSFQYTDTMSLQIYGTDENFDSGLGTFTPSGTGSWVNSTTNPLYENNYARLESSTASSIDSYLISTAFDISNLTDATLTYAYLWKGNGTTNAYLSAEYSRDGSAYSVLALYNISDNLTWTTATFSIPANTVSIRFRGIFPRASGLYAGIDAVQVVGTDVLIDPWFSFASEISGTISDHSDGTVKCNLNASGLAAGEYNGRVIATSNDPVNPVVETPVILTVNPSGIEEFSVPITTELFQNYPNPFNPETMIKYSLKDNAYVKLTVFDITGREVVELVNMSQGKGFHEAKFNADKLTSGIYFYRLSVNDKVVTSKKMMMLK